MEVWLPQSFVLGLILLALFACSGFADDSSYRKSVLRQVRFSPDGRYVLAQEDAGIVVLPVEPFAVLFRIPVDDAVSAQFTQDSRCVVLVSSVTRTDAQSIRTGLFLHRPIPISRSSAPLESSWLSATNMGRFSGAEALESRRRRNSVLAE